MTFTLARSTMLLAATAISTPAWANSFDIHAGDAVQTIPQFAAQADMQVLAPQSVLAGQETRAVRGEMSPAAALARMIEGSQLRAQPSGARTVVISRALRQQASLSTDRAAPMAAAPASAAPAPQAGEAPAGDDIVVTARRTEERLQDVPLAVTAVRGDMLAERGVTQVMDLRQTVAGLNVSSASGRTATPLYSIRGHRAADITVTQDPSVAIYVDDVIVTPLHGGNLGLFDLASVQVLKGPQGTLFGRNTTGGAVLFTTAKPTDRLEGYVKLGYGNHATKTAQAVLNVPVADWLRVRGGVDYTKSNGFGRVIAAPAGANPTNLPEPGVGARVRDRDELSLRFTATMTPAPGFENTTTVFYSRAFSGGPGFKMFDPLNPVGLAKSIFGAALDAAYARQQTMGDYDVESSINPISQVRIFGVSDTLSAQLNDNLTFKSVFGYRRTRYIETNDSDGSLIPILEATNITNIDQYSFEPQLQGKAFDNRLTYILGAYYFDQKGRDFGDGSRTFGAPSSIGGNLHNSSFSGFAQATYALTDTMNLTGGFRYTVDNRAFNLENYTGSSAAPGTCNLFDSSGTRLPIGACVLPVSTSFSSPSWLVSIDRKLTPDVMVYLSHRAGYRSGGYSLRAFNQDTLQSFRPEKVKDIELGVKSTTRFAEDWTLTANLAAYYQWYSDVQRSQQQTVVLGGRAQQAGLIVNAAKAHIYGGELEMELRKGRMFSLSFNYAYVHPKYDSWPIKATIGGVPLTPTDYSDRDFANISRHQINSTLRVSPPIGDIGELNLIANVYYQSKFVYADDFQTQAQLVQSLSPAAAAVVVPNLRFGQKGYALVNLRAELNKVAGSELSVAVWSKNLFDKRYIGGATFFYNTLGLSRYTYGDPRTFGVEVSYKF